MRKVVGAGIASAVFVLAACQLIAGLETRSIAKDAAPDNNTMMMTGDASDPCGTVGFPTRPDAMKEGPSVPGVVFALGKIDFGFADAGASGPYGLNLDKTCTCPGPPTCLRLDASPTCDIGVGVDNNGNALFRKASDLNLVTQNQLNGALASGSSGALVRVDEWNGTPDDPYVTLAVFSSLGIEGWGDGGSPGLDGGDRWVVDDQSVVGGAASDGGYKPVFVDETAWVVNGTLVGALDFPITIGSTNNSRVTVDLTGGVVMGRIEKKNDLYTLSGTFAGRWSAKKMLTSFQAFRDPTNPTEFLCDKNVLYQFVKRTTCDLADIARTPSLDDGLNPCDALAVGIHFDAVQAKLGAIAARPDAGFPCGPTWSDSCSQ